MSALALVTGTIATEPETVPTKTNPVTHFRLEVQNGKALEEWTVSTFSSTAREALTGLTIGDAISAVGRQQIGVDLHDGSVFLGLRLMLTAERILPLAPKVRKTPGNTSHKSKPKRQIGEPAGLFARPFDDPLPPDWGDAS